MKLTFNVQGKIKKLLSGLVIFIIFVFSPNNNQIHANQYSKPIAINPHIRIINYSPNEMHYYTGFYNYVASILFEDGETIKTFAIGDPTAWQITPSGNRLFIKPLQDNPETNALIITNRRVYHVALDAKEAKGLDDPDLVFETRFAYPQINFATTSGGTQDSYIPDINEDSNLNFNYMISGHEDIKPIRIFDDGRFTYMQFSDSNVNLPAVFDVDDQGAESLVNIRTVGKYLVIEKVGSLFTLRYDKEHACVFNQNRPFKMKRSKIEKILSNEQKVKKEKISQRHQRGAAKAKKQKLIDKTVS
jgi:type IV secretion system protein VirB9